MNRGQAALEFLMTYGWALLVVMAAIAALAFFGVLNPSKWLPDKCTASPPFSCTQYKLSSAGSTVNMTLTANAGVDIIVNLINYTCDGITDTTGSFSPGNGSQVILNGNAIAVTWTGGAGGGCTPAFSTNDKYKANFKIRYTKSSETVSHLATGSLQARIE